jgi:hypothetical protein
MRAIAIGVGVVLLGVAGPAAAQRPDLSGTWVAASDAPADVPAAPSPVFGARLWLRQAGDRLTVVRQAREGTVAATFPMDGSEVRTRIPGGVCQGDAESIETVAWEANTLAFTVVGSVPPGSTTPTKASVRRLLRQQSPDVLVIEASMRDSAQAAPRQVGTVYKRSSDSFPNTDPAPQGPKTQATIAQVAWISGVWVGATGTLTVEERWTPVGGGSMLATARTLRGTAMASFEFLCIAERDGGLVYTAMPNARTPATHFTLTAVTSDSATFENPAHDFPKLIKYTRRPDGSLETTISGEAGKRAQSFVLKRQE